MNDFKISSTTEEASAVRKKIVEAVEAVGRFLKEKEKDLKQYRPDAETQQLIVVINGLSERLNAMHKGAVEALRENKDGFAFGNGRDIDNSVYLYCQENGLDYKTSEGYNTALLAVTKEV